MHFYVTMLFLPVNVCVNVHVSVCVQHEEFKNCESNKIT